MRYNPSHPKGNDSGHLEDYDRHLIVLLTRLGFGVNSTAHVAECTRNTVINARKAIKEDRGIYAHIWVKMELKGNQYWKDQLFNKFTEARIAELHPYAMEFRNVSKGKR